MELNQLFTADKHQEGAELRVCDEFNEPTDIYIRLAGQDSEVWQKANRQKQKRAFSSVINKEEDTENYDLTDMVNASLDWRGIEQDGAELEFSKERVRQLYEKAPYILDQAILFIHNRVNFTKS